MINSDNKFWRKSLPIIDILDAQDIDSYVN